MQIADRLRSGVTRHAPKSGRPLGFRSVTSHAATRIRNPLLVRVAIGTVRTLARLRAEGDRLVLVPQALAEFWVVATRPVEVNGLGASPQAADAEIARLLGFFGFVPEPPGAFSIGRRLVTETPVVCRRAHDARLTAAGCDRLLTLDPRDFAGLLAPLGLALVPLEDA